MGVGGCGQNANKQEEDAGAKEFRLCDGHKSELATRLRVLYARTFSANQYHVLITNCSKKPAPSIYTKDSPWINVSKYQGESLDKLVGRACNHLLTVRVKCREVHVRVSVEVPHPVYASK